MSQDEAAQISSRFVVHATSDSHFSWFRTRLSLERTLMAWARTSVSLIGFGFTIVKFFEQLGDMPDALPASHPEAARYLGLAMIAAGVIGLIISMIQYRQVMKYLFHPQFATISGIHEKPGWTPLMLVSALLTLIGISAFISLVFRLV
ncbi:MAG: YidH family protein [Alphaproteobacteria bacterium]